MLHHLTSRHIEFHCSPTASTLLLLSTLLESLKPYTMGVASIVLHSGVDIHVHHISGKDNLHADLLSHLLFDEYKQAFPTDHIHTFEPPQELLPAQWKECF
jgi:hypothetical protein